MKLFHVEANGLYSSFRCVVIADNHDRAEEIYFEHYPDHKKYGVVVNFFTDETQREFIQNEILE